MAQRFLFDSHKLIYHLDRLKQWQDRKDAIPIYAEISLTSACNCRCIFCAFDYAAHAPTFIKTRLLLKRIKEMASLGLRSVNFSGEGEPLLHPDAAKIISQTKKMGLDVSLSTNGLRLSEALARKILPNLSWIRLSINAADKKSYARIQAVSPGYFAQVIKNLGLAVKVKKQKRLAVTIGVQFILLNQNIGQAVRLGRLAHSKGADYYVVKPLIPHPQNKGQRAAKIDQKRLEQIEKELKRLSTPNFVAALRLDTFRKLKEKRPYRRCLALPFFLQISSWADVFTCIPYVGNDKFKYGNIYKDDFKTIWVSKRRKKVRKMIEKLDVNKCMLSCRPDEVNRFLDKLKNPPEHVNFL